MSLRARLLGGVLVMTAVGLLAAGGGTYLALRSFLLDRVNQQLMAARASVGRGLRESQGSTIDSKTLDQVAPPDAFVEVRDESGRVLAVHRATSLSGSSPEPRLPAVLHPPPAPGTGFASREQTLRFDASAEAGTGRYRVLVSSLPASAGVLIVGVSLDDVDATIHRLLVHLDLVVREQHARRDHDELDTGRIRRPQPAEGRQVTRHGFDDERAQPIEAGQPPGERHLEDLVGVGGLIQQD